MIILLVYIKSLIVGFTVKGIIYDNFKNVKG